jgi:hypothetical protein
LQITAAARASTARVAARTAGEALGVGDVLAVGHDDERRRGPRRDAWRAAPAGTRKCA